MPKVRREGDGVMSKWTVEANADVEAIEVNGVKYVPERTCHLIRKEWGDPFTGLYVAYKCDECEYVVKRVDKYVQHTLPNYCPNCGARIKED